MSDTQVYVADESAVLYVGGEQYVIHKGRTRVRAGHPLLKRNAHFFKPLDVHYDVEDATARPSDGWRILAKTKDERGE